MATADKLNKLKQTKADLKAALIEKGQNPGDVFSDYPDMVRAIEGGGGGDESVLDALIEKSITEVSSNASSIGNYIFYSCPDITTVDFPMATSIGPYAFNSCTKLTTVNFPMATSIGSYAFQYCPDITTVDFPMVTSIGTSAFHTCTKLTTVNFPMVTSIGSYAFYTCKALISFDFPMATSIDTYAFHSCSALTTVNFPVATTIGSRAFYACKALTKADFPAVTSIDSYAFNTCTALTYLILRSEKMCTLTKTNALTSTPIVSGNGYIYVPRALVESYKADTNWSYYDTRFRALEDYTVDGTTTGALDESKIVGA